MSNFEQAKQRAAEAGRRSMFLAQEAAEALELLALRGKHAAQAGQRLAESYRGIGRYRYHRGHTILRVRDGWLAWGREYKTLYGARMAIDARRGWCEQ